MSVIALQRSTSVNDLPDYGSLYQYITVGDPGNEGKEYRVKRVGEVSGIFEEDIPPINFSARISKDEINVLDVDSDDDSIPILDLSIPEVDDEVLLFIGDKVVYLTPEKESSGGLLADYVESYSTGWDLFLGKDGDDNDIRFMRSRQESQISGGNAWEFYYLIPVSDNKMMGNMQKARHDAMMAAIRNMK